MSKKYLSQSVIKKIQMAKLLYDLGVDCFKVKENPEKIGAGLVLLQDSVEIFLIAVCEHLNIDLGDYVKFPEYFKKIEKKIEEDKGKKDTIPLKRQILSLNKQRINIKHYGVLPHIEDCKSFPVTVRNFFQDLSARYLKVDFSSITLVDLLEEGEQKELLKQAEKYLKSGNYKECQINCRKALYLAFEKRFDIRKFEKERYNYPLATALLSDAPYYTKNKKYIEEHVKNPTDYISIDYAKLERDLLLNGIMPIDFWNVWRLTPPMYYYEEGKEWVIKEEFEDEIYNGENAEYCFRKTVEMLLLKQRYWEQTRYVKRKGIFIKLKPKKVKVFEKASTRSRINIELQGPLDIFAHAKVRGLDDKKLYYNITHEIEEKEKRKYIFGYICEDDIDSENL